MPRIIRHIPLLFLLAHAAFSQENNVSAVLRILDGASNDGKLDTAVARYYGICTAFWPCDSMTLQASVRNTLTLNVYRAGRTPSPLLSITLDGDIIQPLNTYIRLYENRFCDETLREEFEEAYETIEVWENENSLRLVAPHPVRDVIIARATDGYETIAEGLLLAVDSSSLYLYSCSNAPNGNIQRIPFADTRRVDLELSPSLSGVELGAIIGASVSAGFFIVVGATAPSLNSEEKYGIWSGMGIVSTGVCALLGAGIGALVDEVFSPDEDRRDQTALRLYNRLNRRAAFGSNAPPASVFSAPGS